MDSLDQTAHGLLVTLEAVGLPQRDGRQLLHLGPALQLEQVVSGSLTRKVVAAVVVVIVVGASSHSAWLDRIIRT